MQEVIMPFLYPRVNLYLTIVSGGGLCFIHKSSIWKRLKKLSSRSVFTITFCSLVHRETDCSELRCLRESSCVATRSTSVMADVVLDQTAMMPGDRKAWWNYCILSSRRQLLINIYSSETRRAQFPRNKYWTVMSMLRVILSSP